MEDEDHNSSDTNESQPNSDYEIMCSSTENIDPAVLQEVGEHSFSAEWSVTASALSSSETTSTSSNLYINNDTLKECCDNSSEILNNKEDFMVLESTSDAINISKFNADVTKNLTICKTSTFQKKHKISFNNISHMFENILDDDSQLEITQNSVCLSRFQNRKRLLPSNNEYYVEMNKSDSSGMDSGDVSMKSSKLCFSSKNKTLSWFEVPDYNLSTTDGVSIADDANISKVTEGSTIFKHPSNFSLINASTYNEDEPKTEVLTHKFSRKPIDLDDSAFNNVINDSSMTSNIELNKNTTVNQTAGSNLNRNSMCDTVEMPSLNHTYDVPGNSTTTHEGLILQSIKNYSNLSNSEQPINGTYTLENDLIINNVSLGSFNAINTLSDTYTIDNNLNDTSTQLKSGSKSANKTTSTLSDLSNIYSQSKSSIRKPNFIRKIKLDEVSQGYNITNGGDNSIINDEMYLTENKSKRFKLNKTFDNGNSIIFDNIITSSQKNETSSTDTVGKTMNASIETSINNGINISSEPKKENIKESVNKSITQQSNVHLNEFAENDKNISKSPLLLKYNKSNSFSQTSRKFNFSKQYGRHSLSYHEKSCHNLSVPQNTTFTSQSSGPHFMGKQNLNAPSGVFNDIIDNSSMSNVSLNVSNEVKFKNHKNISEAHSIIFENIITNSQESNSMLTQNKTLIDQRSSVIDQSKIQATDEISLFANVNELSSNEKSSNILNNTSSGSKDSNNESNSNVSNNMSADKSFNMQVNNLTKSNVIDSSNIHCEQYISSTLREAENHSLANISAGLLEMNNLTGTCLTKSASKKLSSKTLDDLKNNLIPNYSTNNVNNTLNHLSKNLSTTSNDEGLTLLYSTSITSNSTLMLDEDLKNASRISTRSSKQKNNSSANDKSSAISVTNELLEKDGLPLLNVTDKFLEKKSNSTLTLKDDSENDSRISTRSSKRKKNSHANNISVVSIANKSNDPLVRADNVQNISTRSSSKSISYSNNESTDDKTNDSVSSISSESSIDSEMIEDDSKNDSRISTCSSKRKKNSHANNISVVSIANKSNDPLVRADNVQNISTRSSSKSISYSNNESTDGKTNYSVSSISSESSIDSETIEDDSKNDSRISTRSSKRKSNSFANNRSLVSIDDKSNKTLVREDNVQNISTRSSSKSISYSNNESTDDKTNYSVSSISSESSIDSEMIEDDSKNDSRISTRSSKRKSNSFANNRSVVSIDDKSNKTLVREDNVQNISTRSSRTSKSISYSNKKSTDDETNDSESLKLSETSIGSEKTSNNTVMLDDVTNNIDTIFTSLSKTSNSLANYQPVVTSIIDDLKENNKTSCTKVTRSSSVSVKNNTFLSNKLVAPENNMNNISTCSSKSDHHPNNEKVKLLDDLNNTFIPNYSINNVNNTLNHLSKNLSTTSNDEGLTLLYSTSITSNSTLILDEDLKNASRISTRSSKQKNNSSANDKSSAISVTNELLEKDGLPLLNVTEESLEKKSNSTLMIKDDSKNDSRISTRSSKRKKNSHANNISVVSIANKSNDPLVREDNVQNISTRSSSKSISYSNNESTDDKTNDSVSSISVESSIDSEMIEDDLKNDRISTCSSVTSIIDDLQENNKTSSTKVTRSSYVSVKNNTFLSNKLVAPENNMNNISTCSSKSDHHPNNEMVDDETNDSIFWETFASRTLSKSVDNNKSMASEKNMNDISKHSSKSVTHSSSEKVDNESNDSVLWETISGGSTVPSKTSDNILIPEDVNNVGTKFSSFLNEPNNSFANDQPAVSSIIDELPEYNEPSSIQVNRLSLTVKNNKSLTNETVSDNKSLVSAINIDNASTRSSRTLKIVAYSNSKATTNETNDSSSKSWTTLSEQSINSRKMSINRSISALKPDDVNNSRRVSARLLNKKNKYIMNNRTKSDTNNSMYRTTLQDNSKSKLPIQNEFSTPINNKLAIRERIINAIGIMSVNKRKSTHPGVFELEEIIDGRSTRSITMHPTTHSPSILTRALVGNNTFESTASFSKTIINDQLVDVNAKEKFKSLYNKELWITKRLYKFLADKLELNYNVYSVKHAEKFVKYLASMLNQVLKKNVDLQLFTDMLRYHMARYGIIRDTRDYLAFLTDYIPKPYYDKLVPDWDLETSKVKFDPLKYYIPIMEDEEFLVNVLENLDVE